MPRYPNRAFQLSSSLSPCCCCCSSSSSAAAICTLCCCISIGLYHPVPTAAPQPPLSLLLLLRRRWHRKFITIPAFIDFPLAHYAAPICIFLLPALHLLVPCENVTGKRKIPLLVSSADENSFELLSIKAGQAFVYQLTHSLSGCLRFGRGTTLTTQRQRIAPISIKVHPQITFLLLLLLHHTTPIGWVLCLPTK